MGNSSGSTFTKYTLKGLFDSFDKAVNESKTTGTTSFIVTRPNALYISYTCWYYSWTSSNGDFAISNTQCSYSLILTPEVISNAAEVENIPPPGDGGGSSLDPIDQLYNCTCNCPEDDAMVIFSNSFEPKWGQLGDLSAILLEIGKAQSISASYNGVSFKDRLQIIKDYFSANRFFTRNQYNQIVDAPNSKKIDRYIYS